MTEQKILTIFLSQFDFSSNKIAKIIEFLGENASLKGFKKTKFPEKVLPAEQKEKMLNMAEEELVKTYVVNLADRGIKIVTREENDFPQKLLDLSDCPQILYYMGDLSLANLSSLSIVGTRKPTGYGRIVTERISADVSASGVVVVSGLAYGVDSIAHRKCLEVGGKTIAVLGGGFEHIYPQEHHSLAMEIAEKGLLLSEFRPKYNATKYSFPLRNRIIAGLGDGVLITEASFNSGTIHTKDFALEYGKNVYAVPGNIDSPLSQLTNDMIKSGQATVVTKSDDILIDYSKKDLTQSIGQQKIQTNFNVTENEQKVLNALKNGMLSLEELTQSVQLPANILNSCLTTLEISGLIRRLPAGTISLC